MWAKLYSRNAVEKKKNEGRKNFCYQQELEHNLLVDVAEFGVERVYNVRHSGCFDGFLDFSRSNHLVIFHVFYYSSYYISFDVKQVYLVASIVWKELNN